MIPDVESESPVAAAETREPAEATAKPGPDVADWALVAGSSIVVLLAACFIFAVLGFAVGIKLGTWLIAPAFATQVVFTYFAWKSLDGQQVARRVVVVLVAIWVALAIIGFAEHSIRDTTTDGKHYQQISVVALANGWNPLHDGEIPSTAADSYLKTDTYPKAAWIVDAVVLKTTNDISAAKLPAAALALAAFLVAIALFSAVGFATKPAIGLALLLAANPIALAEIWTLMVDGFIASILLCAIAFALLWMWKRGSPLIPLVGLIASVLLIVNTKHTGALFAVLVVGGMVALIGWRRREIARTRRLLTIIAACVVVGVVALGVNPYVTNFLHHHHNPLYPVIGPGTNDFTRQYKTGGMAGKSSPERLALAIVSQSAGTAQNPHPKIPFTFTSSEWNAFRSPGLRSGGWGPLFGGVLLLLAIAGVVLVVRRKRCTIPSVSIDLLIAAGCALLVTVVMPDSFVARFAPAFWLVPALAVPALLLVQGDLLVRRLAVAAIVVLGINAAGIAFDSSSLHQHDSSRDASSLQHLSREKVPLAATFIGPYQSTDAYRLDHAHVRYVVTPKIACKTALVYTIDGSLLKRKPANVPSTGVAFCNVNGENLKN